VRTREPCGSREDYKACPCQAPHRPRAADVATIDGAPHDGKPSPKDHYGDPLPAGAIAGWARCGCAPRPRRWRSAATANKLLISSGGATVGRVDAATGRLLGEIHLPGSHSIPVGSRRTVRCWPLPKWWSRPVDIATAKRLACWPWTCTTSPSPRTASRWRTTEYSPKDKGTIRVWDLAAGTDRVLAKLPVRQRRCLLARRQALYAAVDSHSLRAWDLATGKQLWLKRPRRQPRHGFSDGNWLCARTPTSAAAAALGR